MPDPISNYFTQQGILGVIIMMLIGVIVWQQKRLDDKDRDLRESLDLRLKDSKDLISYNGSVVEKYAVLSEKTVTGNQLLMQAVNGMATYLQNKLK